MSMTVRPRRKRRCTVPHPAHLLQPQSHWHEPLAPLSAPLSQSSSSLPEFAAGPVSQPARRYLWRPLRTAAMPPFLLSSLFSFFLSLFCLFFQRPSALFPCTPFPLPLRTVPLFFFPRPSCTIGGPARLVSRDIHTQRGLTAVRRPTRLDSGCGSCSSSVHATCNACCCCCCCCVAAGLVGWVMRGRPG